MQIFELHFNPGLKEDQIFDSFVYEPENIYEKRLGSLYIVGEIQNALPKNKEFLNNLAKVIKKNYYTLSVKTSEKALSQSLKTANKFLSEEIKRNNVNWLGNLNLAVLSLSDHYLTFSKTGNLKILLIRNGQINDIGKDLNLPDIEPYPLKIFFNIISGKLIENDIILILTKEIFDFFTRENKIIKIAKISQEKSIEEKDIKEIFPSSLFDKKEDLKISGICFLGVKKEILKKKISSNARIKNIQGFKKATKNIKKINFQIKKGSSYQRNLYSFLASVPFYWIKKIKSLKILKKQLINQLKKILRFQAQSNKKLKRKFQKTSFLNSALNKIKLSKKTILKIPAFKKKELIKKVNPKLEKYNKKVYFLNIKKTLILTTVLIIILFCGFLVFKNQKQKENKINKLLAEIEKKEIQAENFLIFKDKKKANLLLKEAWKDVLPLTEEKGPSKIKALNLKKSLEEKLKKLNNLEIINNPQIAKAKSNELFLPSPSSLSSSVKPPSFKFSFDIASLYLGNLYFLDKETCQIIKYPSLGKSKWGLPQKWTKDNSHCFKPKSMTIDGSIWILNKDNSIIRYYKGYYKETINLDIFPALQNITKIKTGLDVPYLYFLEPIQKRIIVTSKKGEVIKQFQSEKFNNLQDLAFSKNGKTIYILNGKNVYQIKFK